MRYGQPLHGRPWGNPKMKLVTCAGNVADVAHREGLTAPAKPQIGGNPLAPLTMGPWVFKAALWGRFDNLTLRGNTMAQRNRNLALKFDRAKRERREYAAAESAREASRGHALGHCA